MKTLVRPLLAAAMVLLLVQCQDRQGPVAVDSSSFLITAAATPEQLAQARDIERMIRALFKNSEEQAAVNKFCSAANLYLAGNVTTAHKRLFELMNLTLNRYRAGQLECGQSAACREKLARLFNALNEFFGLAGDDPIPPAAFEQDGAVRPCGPGGCLVVTGTEFAGVRIPPGALSENVVVFVHRLPDTSEPLNTSLDQYPLFYFFGTSPEVEFNSEVNVAVCVLDNPPFEIGAPEGADLRLAHNVGEGVEVLPLGPSSFIDCSDAAPTAFHTPAWNHYAGLLFRPLAPSLLYAMPGPLGAQVSNFSPFGAVDVGEGPPPPPPGTDIVVFNDINVFDNNAMTNADNVRLVQNLVDFTSGKERDDGTEVWVDCREPLSSDASPIDNAGCTSLAPSGAPGRSTFQSTIAGEGYTIVKILGGSLDNIPARVKTIILWIPTVEEYTTAEINAFKQFAEEGGRVVFVGEHAGFYGPWIPLENAFLEAMGAVMRNTGGAVDCGYVTLQPSSIEDHQITNGLEDLTIGCSSVIEPGPNDFVLYFDTSGTQVLSGVATIDTDPLPESLAAASRTVEVNGGRKATSGFSGIGPIERRD
jgi:hypothetical protein